IDPDRRGTDPLRLPDYHAPMVWWPTTDSTENRSVPETDGPRGRLAARVESERELVQVVTQLGFADGTRMRPHQPALQPLGHPIHARHLRVFRPAGEIFVEIPVSPIWERFVEIPFLCQVHIATPVVGTDRAAKHHTLFHKGVQVARQTIPDWPHPHPADARSLDLRSNDDYAAFLLPEFSGTPQLGRTHFDGTVQRIFSSHGAPQLVQPDPGSLVAGKPEQALQRPGAGALPAAGDTLHRPKPEAQRLARPFENCSRRGRRLPPAGTALEARVFQAPVLPAAAMRTAKALRPAQLDQIVAAGRLGRKALRELRDGAQIFLHPPSILAESRSLSHPALGMDEARELIRAANPCYMTL